MIEGVINIVYQTFCGGIGGSGYKVVVFDSQFSGFGQVAVDFDERVKTVQITRLSGYFRAGVAAFFKGFHCRQAGCRAVAVGGIVFMKCSKVAGIQAYDVQQVVVEDAAVKARDEGRRQFCGLVTGQFVGVGHRFPEVWPA